LYSDDPIEKENLADVYPELVKSMTALLDEYRKKTKRPLNAHMLPDPLANPKHRGDLWSPGRLFFTTVLNETFEIKILRVVLIIEELRKYLK
jgi:hypothetical protein